MRFGSLVAALFALGCQPGAKGISADLLVEPRAFTFPGAPVGDTRTASLRLLNASRAPLRLMFSAEPPFSLEPEAQLEGGAARELAVRFTPEVAGHFSAVLHVGGDVTLDVALSGQTVDPVLCVSASPCRASRRDPDTNTCSEVLAADGVACASADSCLAGTCLAGDCVGTRTSCEDTNPCTVDLCSAGGGCSHSARACPAPTDRCLVAACDPLTGCTSAPAPDGTSCGDGDCITSHVCIAGACELRPTPQGTICGADRPCQAKGRCVANACERPAPGPLFPEWERHLPAAWDFRGVTDAQGNLYWIECTTQCQLLSYSASGVSRFAKAIPQLEPWGAKWPFGLRHMVAGDRVYVTGKGVLLYSTSTQPNGPTWVKPAVPGRSVVDFVADSAGNLRTIEHPIAWPDHYYFNSYDGQTGAVLATYKFQELEVVESMVLDETGDAYVNVMNHSYWAPRLISIAADARERFRVPTERTRVRAVFAGTVLMENGDVRAASDGRLLSPPSPFSGIPSSPRGFALASATSWYWWNFSTLAGYPSGSFAARYTFTTQSSFASEAMLLSDDAVLFAELTRASLIQLRVVDSAGADLVSCPLEPSVSIAGLYPFFAGVALTGGRLAVYDFRANSLRVYATPGVSMATSGWVGTRGTPGQSGQSR